MKKTIKPTKIKVFVYGTLLKGHYNHALLKELKAEFKGKNVIQGRMYSLGAFPFVDITETGHVYGEVYEINEENLKFLDRLENYPELYLRTKTVNDLWVYHNNPKLKDVFSKEKQIKSGKWTF